MTYELAKELKDAGFKQYGDNREIDGGLMTDYKDGVEVYFPTLSELIEACKGNGRISLNERTSKKGWCAVFRPHKGVKGAQEIGHTPEEAAAKLWLALNKKT